MHSVRDVYIALQNLRHRRQVIAFDYRHASSPEELIEREEQLNAIGTDLFALATNVVAKDVPAHPLIRVKLLEEFAAHDSSDIVHQLAAELCRDLQVAGLGEQWLKRLELSSGA